jgi:CheY-like chemotaxis protein
VEVERVERLKVSEKLAALGGTLSRAVHEINDPMAAIVGNLDLLMRFDRLKPRIRGRLKVMDEEAHRVVSVVRSLLESAHRDTRRRSPVEEVRPIGPTMEPEPLPLPPEIAAGDPATVLVVDDEPNIVELQRAILDSIGVATIGVASGAEAVGWLSRRDFHAVVSDLRMPGDLSGEDLFGWVESHRPEMAGRFLFVTGDTASEATQQFLERSRRRFVAKPFRMQEYLAAVRETLASANPPGEG